MKIQITSRLKYPIFRRCPDTVLYAPLKVLLDDDRSYLTFNDSGEKQREAVLSKRLVEYVDSSLTFTVPTTSYGTGRIQSCILC